VWEGNMSFSLVNLACFLDHIELVDILAVLLHQVDELDGWQLAHKSGGTIVAIREWLREWLLHLGSWEGFLDWHH